jgi:small subunit ribosomal protein S1
LNRFTPAQINYLKKLKPGQTLQGYVTAFADYGAFVKVSIISGLVFNKDISWGRIEHAEQKLKLRQKIDVIVLKVDEQKQELSLGIKQLIPHPFDAYILKHKEGDVIAANVVDIKPYGVFMEVMHGVEGLLHISEIPDFDESKTTADYFLLEQTYELKILTIDREKKRMAFTLKDFG